MTRSPLWSRATCLALVSVLAPAAAAQITSTAVAPVHPPPGLYFNDVTPSTGFTFQHTDVTDTMGSGVCCFDYDGDGFTDLFATARGGTTNRLFRNQRNGTYTDVTAAAGLTLAAGSMGAYAADADNNGTQDLLVLLSGAVRFYRNNGDGTFTDVSSTCGIQNNWWAASATFGDYDRDGLVDLYIGNYVDEGFFPYFNGAPNRLFHNEGNLTFKNVSAAAGVEGWKTFWDPRGFYRSTYACTLSTLFFDYDRDGWMDLLVGNDFGPFIIGDLLYRNERNGTFTEVAASVGFAIEEFNMGLVTADVNGDLIPDIYTTNLGDNHLLLNDGRRFTDVNHAWGVAEGMSNGLLLTSWACMFLDADLDGYRDLYVSNGYINTPPPMLNDPNAPSRLLRSLGRSYEIVPQSRFPWDLRVGRGAACADMDNDGDEDLVQLNNQDLLRVYRNESTTGNNSLTLDLIGTLSNRDGIGANVVLRGPQFTQALDHTRGGSYGSCNGSSIVFGLGSDTRADELTVTWPSGVESRLLALDAGTRPQVVEPSVTIESIGAPRAAGASYLEIPVTVVNHAATAEAVSFSAGLSWGATRIASPAYFRPVTLGARARTTEPVYLPIPFTAVPTAQQLGMWLQINAHSRGAGQDQVERPF